MTEIFFRIHGYMVIVTGYKFLPKDLKSLQTCLGEQKNVTNAKNKVRVEKTKQAST